MRIPFRAAERFTLAALLALATATCTDQPTEPLGAHAGQVRFTPVFATNTFAAGLPLDQVTVTVVRPAAETLAVRSAPFTLTDSVLQLDIPVTLQAAAESLEVTIDLLSGATLLFRGLDTILVTSGATTTPPAITMNYVGPGANIAFLSVSPRDTVLSFGDTLVYGASASDALENPVGTFYLRWWTSPAGTPIRVDGQLIAPNARGTVMVHAWTPSGVQDSTTVTFVPVPTQLLKSGGDLQGGLGGDTLPTPLTVQVRAADNLGVAGIPVTFAAVTAGGAVLTTNAITDSLGFASTVAVLGDTARSYSYTATVAGLTPVTFQATANAGAAALIAKIGGDAQSDTTGQLLANPLVVRVADALDNPVTGAKVYWTLVAGDGTLEADSSLTSVGGQTQIHYILGSPGTDTIRATIAGTGAYVEFTTIAVAGGFSIVEISGNGQSDTVGRTLSTPMVAEVHVQGTSTPAAGVMVQFSILYGGGSLSVDSALSDSLGRVQVTYTVDTLAGAAEVMAETPTAGQYVTFQVTKVAGAPHHLAFAVTPPDTVQVGVAFAPVAKVQVRDSFGNPVLVAGYPIRVRTETDLNPPAAPPMQRGAIQFSGGVAGTDSVTTDSTGTATFTGLVVLGSTGPETFHFFGDTLVLPFLDHAFTLIPGLPISAIPVAGNGQSAFIDSAVAVPPQVLVVDTSGNGVPGVTVNFVVTGGGGSVTGANPVTDSLGYATVGSWTLGGSPGANTLEGQVGGASPAVFNATATPLTPTIMLTLLNTNVVGVGRTATLKVALSSPDTAGVVVSLNNLNPGVVTLDSASATFGPIDTTRFRVLSGVSAGSADIIASAPGFLPDTITVTGSLNLITLPTTSNVAFGQTASLPVQLALPAPAGGVVVNITSLDPSKVSVVTPTVTFNAGEQLKNATVSGVAVGSAQVVADNPNYAPDTSLVSTTASLNITAATLSAFSTFGAQFTTEFRSGGSLTPAPTGGITVTLTPRDPTCVAAPATTLIPQGQTSISDSLDYGGSATLPCVTYLVATASGIDPDSVQVTVNPPPAATLNFSTIEVGSGLQYGNYSVSLAVSSHGGRTISVRSLDTTKVVIQPNNATAGTDSIGVFVPNGTSSMTFWVAGKEGIVSDSALVVTEVTGFRPDTGKVYVRQGAFDLQGVPSSVNTFAGNSNVYVQMGIGNVANTFMNAYQGPRVGGTLARLATVTLSGSGVAQLVDSTATPDTVKTATFPVGQYYTPTSLPGGLQIDPIGPGTVTVTASVPGLVPLPGTSSRSYTVNPALITFSNATVEVGSGLQYGNFGINLSGPNHGGTTVRLKVLTPGVALVQPDNATAGTDSIDVVFPNGTTNLSYWIAGWEGIVSDSVLMTATAPGFIADTVKIYVRQPAFDLQGVPTTTGSLSGNSNLYVQLGLGNVGNTFMNSYQGPRVGGTMSRLATVTVSPGTVVQLVDSTATPDSTKTATFPVGQYYTPTSLPGGLQLDPLAPGTATVTASVPGVVPLPGTAVRTVNVTGPAITMPTRAEVGSGLQSGSYNVNLSASGHGGVNLTLRTLTPGIALLQPNNTTPGTDTLQSFIPNGTSSYTFWIAGLEGITADSVQAVAEITGFTPDTMWLVVRRPVFELSSVPSATTTLSPNSNIWVQMGVPNATFTTINAYQGTRAGQPGATFTVRSNAPTVVRIVDSAGFGDSLSITTPPGQYYTPTSVTSGGIGVDPLTTGSTQIVATHPVYLALPAASPTITVATPGITVNGGTVGSGLQRSQSFTLGASQHGGVTVKVWSTAPGILKVSPDATTPGTDTIFIPIANGNTSGNYYIQGMEGQTGSPTIQVSANGFTDGTASATVVAPAIELTNVPTAPSSGAANQAIWAQVGVANGIYTVMNEYQNIRAGGADSLQVTFTNSNGSAAQLTTPSLTGNTVTAWIIPGRYYTPTSFASGGVAFDPLAPGATTVTGSLAGFTPLPGATVNVNVGP